MSPDESQHNVIWASSERNRDTVKRMETRFLQSYKRNVLHKTYLNQVNLAKLSNVTASHALSQERSTYASGNLTKSKIKYIAPLKTEFVNRVTVDKLEPR